jgi:hypothetical protein
MSNTSKPNIKHLNDQHTQSCLRTIVGNYYGNAKMPYLVGKNQENCEITCINKLDFVFNESKTKAHVEIKRESDAIIIDAICFKFNELNGVTKFINQLKTRNLFLTIKSDQTNLQYLHLGLLTEIEEPFIDKDNITVTISIPSKYLLNKIYLLALKNEKIHIEVDICQELITDTINESISETINAIIPTNVSLYVKCLYYETKIRKNLGLQITSSYIQHLNGGLLDMSKSKPYALTTNDFTYKFNLLTDNYTKGFILCSDKIDKIKYFTLQLYDETMIDYDKYCLHKYCTRISNNLLYIPINTMIREPFCEISNSFETIQTDKVFSDGKTSSNLGDLDIFFGLNFISSIGYYFCNETRLEPYFGAVDLEKMDFKCISITFDRLKDKTDNLITESESSAETNQISSLGIYTISVNHMVYFGSEGKLKLLKNNDFNVVCHKTKEIIFESIKPILSENDMKRINECIGFWRYIWNDTDFGMTENHLWTEIPIENSVTDKEKQAKYIAQLIELEKSDKVFSDTYLGKHRCRICNDYIGCEEYTFRCDKLKHFPKKYVWPESYVHYLKDHNVKIDNRMVKILDSIEQNINLN